MISSNYYLTANLQIHCLLQSQRGAEYATLHYETVDWQVPESTFGGDGVNV